jgi:methionine sulfoxide reductase heme-binding subunit
VTRRARLALKAAVWVVALLPVADLLVRAVTGGDFTANPIDFVTRRLGDWTLRLLLASLAVTPLRLLTGWGWPALLRRLLGLLAFFYAALHFGVWLVLDHFFDWPEMAADIVKRPYITVGMAALLLLVPLAATSTAGMIKRLGARTWRRLQRLVYACAVLAILHFVWLAKVGRIEPAVYAAILAVLLGVRAVDALRRLARRRAIVGVTATKRASRATLS